MKTLILLLMVLIIMPANIFAITLHEAKLYGSRILVCNNEVVKNWKLMLDNKRNINGADNSQNYLIHIPLKHKTYTLNECSFYECSPEPDRMYLCTMPSK